ncbi:DUF3617 family protein [Brevundimonas sp. Root1423]|uniref:DUF3617 domain-containing protein n=1 Tax=Brevundimonas sp. Root1423 TaxID=1736462 RepID=UPI0006F40721|nr:DUF3617 family protein [Brevundimonas sp. Root1423]KQY85102.1 hypothetical protein ASD25_08980 [Brevundimonas sp. Root1423]
MRFLPLMIAASGALALTACSQADRKDAGEPVEATASESGAPITTADFPSPRAGLWRTTTVRDGGEPEIETRCEGPAKPFETPEAMEGCTDTASRIPGGVRFDRKCMADGKPASLSITMTGDFKTRANMNMDYKATLPNGETVESSERGQSVYLGPCAAGQAPGVVEDGQE